MRLTLLAAISALALALVGGCGNDDPAAPAPPQSDAAPAGDLVVYSRIGGIAYSEDRLEVDRDGHAVLTSELGQGEQRREFELSGADLTDLEAQLAAAMGIDAPGPTPGCSDCYVYSVKAEGVSLNLDDASFGDVGIAPEVTGLIQFLGALVERRRNVD